MDGVSQSPYHLGGVWVFKPVIRERDMAVSISNVSVIHDRR